MFKKIHFLASLMALSALLISVLAAVWMPTAVYAKADPEGVAYIAKDYSYTGPDTLAAGWQKITLVNQGSELHEAQFIRLEDGKTVNDLVKAIEGGQDLPTWAKFYGGPNAPLPGQSSTAITYLDPGNYAIICEVPDDADGKPHALHGMVKAIKVVKGDSERQPHSSFSINAVDFKYTFKGQVKAGQQMIRFNNYGTERHQAFLIKLAPGTTVQDWLAAFANHSDKLPGMPYGGSTGIEPGMSSYIVTDLQPGTYGVVCFFDDPVTHKPHFLLGMTGQFTVSQ